MNALSTEIITKILGMEIAWDKKTRELRYHEVINMLNDYRNLLYFHEVTVPLYNHATALLRAFTPEYLREEHFIWDESMWDSGIGGWAITECSEECSISDICEELGELVDYRSQMIWESHNRWSYEHPSEEEILALGIRPSMVPEKVNKKTGAVQKSML